MGVDIGICLYDAAREEQIKILESAPYLTAWGSKGCEQSTSDALKNLFGKSFEELKEKYNSLLAQRYETEPKEHIHYLQGHRWANLPLDYGKGELEWKINVPQKTITPDECKRYITLYSVMASAIEAAGKKIGLDEKDIEWVKVRISLFEKCVENNMMLFPN